jgi:hypothetical protein
MNNPGPPPDDDVRTPLSFKLMVGVAMLYLGWRLVQGVVWVFQQLFS